MARLLFPLRLIGTLAGAVALIGVGMAAGTRRVLGRRTAWDDLPEWGRSFVRHVTAQWLDHGRIGCSWRILERFFDESEAHGQREVRRVLVAGGWLREIHDAGASGAEDGFIPVQTRALRLPSAHGLRRRRRATAVS